MSCVSKRSKLDSLLTDEERRQLIIIYEALPYDKENGILLARFRDLLQSEITRLKSDGKLIESLWDDWHDINIYLRRLVLAQNDREAKIDRLSFLHMWKTHGTSKRQVAGLCCTVKRQQMSATDYDEQSWRISYIKKLLVAKNGAPVPQT
eukprot:CAMPEP_0204901260 /NCGR_PEP_ID=MMETSP1397-20131031/2976_1 /ASSEMBLY_ACC=CAM_ASM_000891 /TAXON_ID=49980 /ORGANISM="Climacostomum Climacostomum virens, Strain Stock W-24" /LENGTH=149 /DNA_ID=CAMNT_0052069587 /DNA_START=230 /DNA_END=679 /DNA_ORIENTATION=-